MMETVLSSGNHTSLFFDRNLKTSPLGPVGGTCEGVFRADPHGEEQTFFEIQLTVEDTGNPLGPTGVLTGTQSIEIYPRSSAEN